jgi:hypothetical protein
VGDKVLLPRPGRLPTPKIIIQMFQDVELDVPVFACRNRHLRGGFVMSRRPPSTCLTADELKQIAAIKFNEAASASPGPEQQKILRSAQGYENLAEMKRYLACKELQPPK